jgi:hypothetical protein
VTPFLLISIFLGAYLVRPFVTDSLTRRYFFPALTLKIVGAIALGLLYQFYYPGGDTFVYHTHGSRHVWEAFMESPLMGIRLLFADGVISPDLFDISDRIWYFRDQRSYFIIRVASVFDLITFSSYSATASLFAVLSFVGGWMLYLTFYKRYREKHFLLALATLFVPSVIFWGSGILKDTVTLAFIGIVTFELDRLFLQRKFNLFHVVLLILSLYGIFIVRKFMLQAYMPAAFLWIAMYNYDSIRSTVFKAMFMPMVVVFISVISYWFILKVGEGDKRYSIENIGETSRITAYDIRYYSGREAGSGYSLGELDGTLTGMLRLAPQAVNVTLFRPYPWEASNTLMLLSSLEGGMLLVFTVYCLTRYGRRVVRNWKSPEVLFCLTFALVFAFGAGVSTFNFGSLARYKIAMLPFYIVALVVLSRAPSPFPARNLEHEPA